MLIENKIKYGSKVLVDYINNDYEIKVLYTCGTQNATVGAGKTKKGEMI